MSEISTLTIKTESALKPIERIQWEVLVGICMDHEIGPEEAMLRITGGESVDEKKAEPLTDAEISLMEIYINGKLEREQPNIAALCRGLIVTARAFHSRVAELESLDSEVFSQHEIDILDQLGLGESTESQEVLEKAIRLIGVSATLATTAPERSG